MPQQNRAGVEHPTVIRDRRGARALCEHQPAYTVVQITYERSVEYQRLGSHQQRRCAGCQRGNLSVGECDIPNSGLCYGTACIVAGRAVSRVSYGNAICVVRRSLCTFSALCPAVNEGCPRVAGIFDTADMVPRRRRESRCCRCGIYGAITRHKLNGVATYCAREKQRPVIAIRVLVANPHQRVVGKVCLISIPPRPAGDRERRSRYGCAIGLKILTIGVIE